MKPVPPIATRGARRPLTRIGFGGDAGRRQRQRLCARTADTSASCLQTRVEPFGEGPVRGDAVRDARLERPCAASSQGRRSWRPTLRQPWRPIVRAIDRAVWSGSNMALLLLARSRQYRSRSKSRRDTAADPRRWTLRSGWPGATDKFRLTDVLPPRPTTFQWR
jgi:hypothetical protein